MTCFSPFLTIITVTSLLVIQVGCAITEKHDRGYETIEAETQGDTESARKYTDKALKQIADEDWEAAQESLEKALVADVSYGPAHNNFGKLYFREKKYYLAAWEFEYAARLLPDRAEPLNNLGLVYEAVDRIDEALSYFEQASGIDPDNTEALGNRARVLVRSNDMSPSTAMLLREVQFRDEREDWQDWAAGLLNTRYRNSLEFALAPATESTSNPTSPILPRPERQLGRAHENTGTKSSLSVADWKSSGVTEGPIEATTSGKKPARYASLFVPPITKRVPDDSSDSE